MSTHARRARHELDDLRAARRAGVTYDRWKQDPSVARPYGEFRAELVSEGVLSEGDETQHVLPEDLEQQG